MQFVPFNFSNDIVTNDEVLAATADTCIMTARFVAVPCIFSYMTLFCCSVAKPCHNRETALGGYVDAAVRPHGRPVSWVVSLALPPCRLGYKLVGFEAEQVYAAAHAS